MPKSTSPNPLAIETKEYQVFDPKNVKQTIEKTVKPTPTIDQLETVEKVGKPIKPKKIIRKSPTTSKTSSSKKFSAKKSYTPSSVKPIQLKKDGYILVITEKPQAAAKIAAALSDGKDKKINKPGGISYYQLERNNKQVIVGCAVGHLFSVSQTVPGTDYPIFDIGWFPNSEVSKRDFTKKYYTVLKGLVKGASEIVIATDFDTEGEVIGYNILRFIAGQSDAKRMKFSSLTAPDVQKAYDNVNPTIEWGQAIAGETRHFLDWLYGINLSRALMNAIKTTGKFRVMSIGRVQGPTLHMIVDKEKEIQAFKPTPYWQIFITINDGKNKLELKHNKDITKKEELKKFEKLNNKKEETTTKKTKQTITPPTPFDLTTLQTEAYKFHSITPSQTLQIAQKLYLGGLISYPRTSSQKIPEEMKPLKILKQLEKKYPHLTKHTTKLKPIEGKKSDPAHPAIIPTGNNSKLEDQDEKIYNLILKRFISCFCDNAELENKKVELTTNVEYTSDKKDSELEHDTILKEDLKFTAKGMEILKKAWMEVYPVKMDEKEIPDFEGVVTIESTKIEEKETKPPKRFSPASIVSELEKRNLGTKATRANILETLYNRNYIKEKSIQATELGIRLIDSLEKHSPIIIEEKLTREIEKDMDNIRASKNELKKKQEKTINKAKDALTKISTDFKLKETEIGKELVQANEALWEIEKEDNKLNKECPSCKKGNLTIKYTPRFKSYFVACDQYPDCKQTFSLPSNSLIKKSDNKPCEECNWPQLIRIKQGKRPWIFCFNPQCPSRKELDISGKDKINQPRYSGQKTEIKDVKEIEKV